MRILFAVLLLAVAAPLFADDAPLTLDGSNTVIYDRSVYAGRWMQYYLIEAVAKHPEADKFHPSYKPKPDHAAAPAFKLYTKESDIPESKHVIAVGTHKTLGEPYLTEEDKLALGELPGTVLIRRVGSNIVIANSAENPWLFGHIVAFLDKVAGVRMYAPGTNDDANLWLSKPTGNTFAVDKLDYLQKPYFAKTAFSSMAHERNREWYRMNTPISEGNPLRASHTIINYFKPEKYFEKYPQLYPMAEDGTRPRPTGQAWNPCFADPQLAADVTMQSIEELFSDKRGVRPYLSFGIMDYHYDCKCDTCQASLKKHNNAGPIWFDYLNIVARRCKEKYPNLYLTAYAYANIDVLPGMKIEPNIAVDYVTKSYYFSYDKRFAATKQHLQTIADTGASWITHDWDFSGVTPRLYNRQWASFLQWAAKHGMKGIYVEWSPGEAWYLDGAKYWILRQLMSDPYQDVDSLWRQYCFDMFGEAAEPMYTFYQMFARKHIFADEYYSRDDLPRREMTGFDKADLSHQRALLEEAIARTKGDAIIQQRLAIISRYFRGHELWATATHIPGRAYHEHTTLAKRTDINKKALAFYVNDDGSTLLKAVDFYDNKRTVEPDSHPINKALGADLSYRSNYSRALGTILQAVRTQALADTDVASMNKEQVRNVTQRAVAIYRDNLPAKYDQQRAQEIEGLFRKMLWIPRTIAMPTIDGKLDDEAWQNAADLTDFTLADLILPTKQGNETTGKVMRVGDQLLLAINCEQPNGVWAKTTPDVFTGTRIWRESCCEFFFGPQPAEGEKPEYFQYIVNSLGAYRGFQTALDNRANVQAAAVTSDDGKRYTIEVSLPLKVEGKYDYTKSNAFNFTIMRQIYYADTYSPPERLGWHPMFFTAHNAESRGLVFME